MNPHSHLLPCPPTLLIQDLRLHMAFLLFTASHSRRWPVGHGGKGTHAVKVLTAPQRLFPQSSWGEATTRRCAAQRRQGNKPSPPTRGRPPLTRWALPPTSRQFFLKSMEVFNHQN